MAFFGEKLEGRGRCSSFVFGGLSFRKCIALLHLAADDLNS
jgi:hypothetical protein